MDGLPTGLVTFVFTDIEGSTRLLEHLGLEAYGNVIHFHNRIMREAITGHHGVEVATAGDSFFVVFATANDAVAAVLDIQRQLSAHSWPGGVDVRVRIGVHTGEGRLGGTNYIGLAVHQGARVAAAAHGGQVLATQPVQEAAKRLPAGASWLSLGRHRLKDLAAPIELFQLCHPRLGLEFPPLRTLEAVSHNLPVQISSFLGRANELVEGAAMLHHTRLLSITGPGGTGKTRLAYQLALEHVDEYPDGVWVAELGARSDPNLVPAALMAAIGLRDEPGRSATETIVSHLRNGRCLVVLDNCEHLVASAAALTNDLLRGCPRMHILATTREPLRVTGETVWALPPLVLPESHKMPLEVLAASDAIALFCARATEAKSTFSLTPENADLVTRICIRLQGIPLALELAAARVRTLSLDQMATRLDHSLDLLTKGTRGAESRRASLRGAIAWSHNLLTPGEQLLFRRLAVFAGGFTLAAAERAWSVDGSPADEALDLLDALVDKSLLTPGGARAGEQRYGMLETIREFAAERLSSAGEASMVAEVHAIYYAQLALDAARAKDRASGFVLIDADHPNLLAALDHLSHGLRPIEHGQLLVNLSAYWDSRGHWETARREFLRYLDSGTGDQALTGHCISRLGTVTARLGDFAQARAYLEKALLIARDLGDLELEGIAIGGLGDNAFRIGDQVEAGRCYELARGIACEIGDRHLEGRWVGGLGEVASKLGNYALARSRVEEALAIARELGDSLAMGNWIGYLGNVAFRLGDHPGARAHYEEALRIALEIGDRRLQGTWLANLANVELNVGEYSQARDHFDAARDVSRELGDRRLENYCLGALGEVACAVGDHADARAHYGEAVGIAHELGDRSLEAQWVAGLGEVGYRFGDYPEARARFEAALDIARELGDRRLECQCVGGLAGVASRVTDYPQARSRFDEALDLALELGKVDPGLLEACAGFLGTVGHCQDAAILLAASDNINRLSSRTRDDSARAQYESTLALCQASLDPGVLAASSDHGAALDWAAAAGVALGSLRRWAG